MMLFAYKIAIASPAYIINAITYNNVVRKPFYGVETSGSTMSTPRININAINMIGYPNR
jgi:hypothetical protein